MPALPSGSGGASINVPISMPISIPADSSFSEGDAKALQDRLQPQMEDTARAVIVGEMRPGGALEHLQPAYR
jgi:hypothetical protein